MICKKHGGNIKKNIPVTGIEFLDNMDWGMFSSQKSLLINVRNILSEYYSDLDGIINLLDAIQDFMVDTIKAEEFKIFTSNALFLKNYRRFVTIDRERSSILTAPALVGGGPDLDSDGNIAWCVVSTPESQAFLDEVNELFGTNFDLDDFSGR